MTRTAMATNPDFMIEDRVDLYERFRAIAADAAPRSRPSGRAVFHRLAANALRSAIAFGRENAPAIALGFMAGLLVTVGLADLIAVTVLS